MKNRMFSGIGVMALAFTLAVVGVDAFVVSNALRLRVSKLT
jgi:hypothetical protein